MEDKVFRKLFRPGGSLDVSEAFKLVSSALPNMTRLEFFNKLIGDNEEAKHTTSSGSTRNKPRGRIDGVHVVTDQELKEEATILIVSATRVELSNIVPIMVLQRTLPVEDDDILMSYIGFDSTFSITLVIAVASFSGSFPSYGMTKTMMGMLPNIQKAYKTGGVIGHADMGSVVVSGISNKPNLLLLISLSLLKDMMKTMR